MNVQGLGHIQNAETRSANTSKAKALKSGAKKPPFSISDTVEISSSAKERNELILQVKKKIKSGYYSSDLVIEDLSHGFAKIMNQL